MGAFDEVKGKVKEQVGSLTGDENLRREGQLQDAKGENERKETEARAEAQAHEKKAEALAREQEQVQND